MCHNFKNPSNRFRGFPFWAWNSTLNDDELREQICIFEKMGFGGFHMHVRQGLEVEYLSDDFMHAVSVCADEAESRGMYAFLYDEDRWPSGAAGGFVTKNKMYRLKYLQMTADDCADCYCTPEEAAEHGGCLFVAAFAIQKDSDGFMNGYRRIERNEAAADKRYFFVRVAPGGEPRYNYQSYTDTLNKDAMDEFVRITHEAYYRNFADKFGKTIPAIFTDEPQTIRVEALENGFSKKEAHLAWTFDFAETFEKCFGYDITDKLPELFFTSRGSGDFKTRYDYHRHVSERFCAAFTDNIGKWCGAHGIALTGHVLGEDSLWEMCLTHSDAMRNYRYMQIPGIDVLFNDDCFTTAVQCRSVVRQFAKSGMASEMFGVTGWDFDFRGQKYQCDWQMCLGVTMRVPHLAWQTMKGEGKRDYPASIFYQSPWYTEYSYMENYFARVCSVLSQGEAVCHTAVIHPVETYWMLSASKAESGEKCAQADAWFHELCRALLTGGVDFDYIAESLVDDMNISALPYDTIIAAECVTLRPSTIKFLHRFAQNGGRLIIMGTPPSMSLGEFSHDAASLCTDAECIPFDMTELFALVRPDVLIQNSDGTRTNDLLFTRRHCDGCDWIFVAQAKQPILPHITDRRSITVTVDGMYVPKLFDTLSGDVCEVSCTANGGKTKMYFDICNSDSLLIQLTPTDEGYEHFCEKREPFGEEIILPSKVDIILAEPNVLLLDRADFYLDGKLVCKNEEMLRADNAIREILGFDKRETKVVQPWAVAGEPEDHTVTMRFSVLSDICCNDVHIALENGAKAEISLNGIAADKTICGYYVDKNIVTRSLPPIKSGQNTLEISVPFGVRTDLENCFILGDFGCECVGDHIRITEKPAEHYYGSVVHGGYPFYGGNLEYRTEFELDTASDIRLAVSLYGGTFVKVLIDGEEVGNIAFAPYELTVSGVGAGVHSLSFVLFGNRYNTFSSLHNLSADKPRVYIGPAYWRSKGDNWSYEYHQREFGILKKPILCVKRQIGI